jgi:3-oxoacyl-[acyl-carrier protein] reductase
MEITLEGKRALICGASRGIGRGVAQVLAEMGAEVVLLARNEEMLQEVCSSLPAKFGQKHKFATVDLSDWQVFRKQIDESIAAYGNFHILVNNSGGPAPGPIVDAKPEDFIAAFNQHLVANHMLMQKLLPGMKEAGYGRIINVVSTSVKVPIDGLGVSNTVRAAVASWAKTLSNEVGKFGITVNNVLPGSIQTSRLDSILTDRGKRQDKTLDDVRAAFIDTTAVKRFGTVEEIAGAIGFLASSAANYITGVSLAVDGGRTKAL